MSRPPRTLATELGTAAPGTTVTLMGHVHRRRILSSVTFLVLRDRTGLAQVVLHRDAEHPADVPPEETVVRITGLVAANPQAPGGAEVVSPQIEVLGEPA
ncbi:MAG TPA: OB-fold nucleic acid binding domain-containing protein, partial [Microbacterium sp.]|nr:OB-fold nucleic acid binding domain-containing protein [Microbacterium sp.]